ncbi:hypothetical protein Lser_V15G01193 [Lactuca serriola]
MEEREQRMRCSLLFAALLIGCFVTQICSSSDSIFYDSFDESFEGRWIVSENEDYSGVWQHSKSDGHEDYGLLVSEKARKYAIVKELEKPLDLQDTTTILQFEVRLQQGLECGGAYLKYLRPQDSGWSAKLFNNESPYSIMFGPDKCGATNKVHFILKHKNPINGEYTEHHLTSPPSVPSDKLTHVYTAIINPGDNDLRILVDGKEKKKANFLSTEDFQPSIIPEKTIPDPDDKKPKDWDERAKIPDPDAVKPEDWDENAPMEILDEEAEMPEGWMESEPEEIEDPESLKPEDWDDEEDGEWEAPKIENPKCESAPGCGEWKRPMKRNPDYKGKWHAPLIENPNYKGIWKPRQIPNPNYFTLENPNFDPIAAVGIEIWTMQDGILFDNILIGNDEKVAKSIRDATWKPKFLVEDEKRKAEEKSTGLDGLKGIQKAVFDVLYKIAELPFLGERKTKVLELVDKAKEQPNLTVGLMVSILVVVCSISLKVLFGGKKHGKVKVEVEDGKKDEGERKMRKGGNNEDDHDATGARKRNARREQRQVD